MKPFLFLILIILIPFITKSQDLNGRWSGTGTQKIGDRVFTYHTEANIKHKGNRLSGKIVTVETGTKNHSIVKISGTIKNGKVKLYPDQIVKIDFPQPNYEIVCIRNFKGEFTVDEINNRLVIELESYGVDTKYDLITKTYSDGNCPPSNYRLTKKRHENDDKSLIAKDSVTPVMTGTKEIKLSAKTVKIKVWDKYEEDGDLINLYLNGKILFSDLEVTKKGEILEIELQRGDNIIEVKALNEGRVSPNTSAIRIFVNDQEYDIILSAKKGKRDSLKIILD